MDDEMESLRRDKPLREMIIFVHLLNDYSGSPRVLFSVIASLTQSEKDLRLFMGAHGAGCLDQAGVFVTRYWYRRTPYRLLTFITYLCSQFCLLFQLFRSREIERNAIIYVNTLLPFGAAIFGWLTGRSVIYHLHEVSVSPAPLRYFLTSIARLTAKQLIYVSKFHRVALPISSVRAATVYNALDDNFLLRASGSAYAHRRKEMFTVLMLASLRDYKGVPEFLRLANQLTARTDIRFELVGNDSEEDTQRYLHGLLLPPNLTVYPRTSDPSIRYATASLVVNLSRPDMCVETFGLTLLEAMAYGVPVIAPPVGGPVELVHDGEQGFLIDSRNTGALCDKMIQLAEDELLCLRLSKAARERASKFSSATFSRSILEVVNLKKLGSF